MCLESLRVKVENHLDKRVKSIISNRGGECYDKYDGSGKQYSRLFAKFLEDCGIISQSIMLGSPIMNDVTKIQNMTFKDMVRSMICYFTLSKSLWEKHLRLQCISLRGF